MVTHDDVCDSCDAVGRTCRMRWPGGKTREMCGPYERQWQLIWRHFCEFQPRQANRVRAQASCRGRARPDDGEPMTDRGKSLDSAERKKVQWVPLFSTGIIEIARECHTLSGLHLNIFQKPI